MGEGAIQHRTIISLSTYTPRAMSSQHYSSPLFD
jgi:hypothetical protein